MCVINGKIAGARDFRNRVAAIKKRTRREVFFFQKGDCFFEGDEARVGWGRGGGEC